MIRELIYKIIINKSSKCAEIGVHKGINASKIIKSEPKELHLIDCWECQKDFIRKNNIKPNSHVLACNEKHVNWMEEVKDKFKKNKNVSVIKNYSVPQSQKYINEYFDFIYIDGLHDYNSVLQDITAWAPKLKKTGIIVCDDYIENEERGYGVIPGIKEFLNNNNMFIGHELPEHVFIIKYNIL